MIIHILSFIYLAAYFMCIGYAISMIDEKSWKEEKILLFFGAIAMILAPAMLTILAIANQMPQQVFDNEDYFEKHYKDI